MICIGKLLNEKHRQSCGEWQTKMYCNAVVLALTLVLDLNAGRWLHMDLPHATEDTDCEINVYGLCLFYLSLLLCWSVITHY